MPEALEYALRTSLAFLIVLFLTSALGRKQLAQTTVFDFVSTISFGLLAVSTLVTHALSIFTGLIALTIWGSLLLLINVYNLKNLPAHKFLARDPVMVIHNGKILENNLAKTYYNVSALLEQLKAKNVLDPAEVRIGIIEIDGELSVLKKTDQQTKTANFTGKELIIDGQIIDTAVRRAGLTREWLQYELTTRGIADVKEVILAAVTPSGKLYIDIKER